MALEGGDLTSFLENSPFEGLVGFELIGSRRWDWNGVWRANGVWDYRVSFEKKTIYSGDFFIYWRGSEKRWVIDDGICHTGPVYSDCSEKNQAWFATPDWTDNPNISTRKVLNDKGYEQEAIEVIFGSIDPKGSIVKGMDDGIYLRLPPENDINNHPHYLLDSTHHIRHIFWQDGWNLAPESNSKFGSCMMSATADIEGKWRTMGESIEEDRARFRFIFQEEDIPSKIYSYALISTFCDDDGLYNKFGDFNTVYNNHLARHNTKRAVM
jgi:hypothetical protein